MHSWSWPSVNTSSDDGLPILWTMVYSSSLYRGFSCRQKWIESTIGRKEGMTVTDDTSCSLWRRAFSSGFSSSLKSWSKTVIDFQWLHEVNEDFPWLNSSCFVTYPPCSCFPRQCQFTNVPRWDLRKNTKNTKQTESRSNIVLFLISRQLLISVYPPQNVVLKFSKFVNLLNLQKILDLIFPMFPMSEDKCLPSASFKHAGTKPKYLHVLWIINGSYLHGCNYALMLHLESSLGVRLDKWEGHCTVFQAKGIFLYKEEPKWAQIVV